MSLPIIIELGNIIHKTKYRNINNFPLQHQLYSLAQRAYQFAETHYFPQVPENFNSNVGFLYLKMGKKQYLLFFFNTLEFIFLFYKHLI